MPQCDTGNIWQWCMTHYDTDKYDNGVCHNVIQKNMTMMYDTMWYKWAWQWGLTHYDTEKQYFFRISRMFSIFKDFIPSDHWNPTAQTPLTHTGGLRSISIPTRDTVDTYDQHEINKLELLLSIWNWILIQRGHQRERVLLMWKQGLHTYFHTDALNLF